MGKVIFKPRIKILKINEESGLALVRFSDRFDKAHALNMNIVKKTGDILYLQHTQANAILRGRAVYKVVIKQQSDWLDYEVTQPENLVVAEPHTR